MKNTFPKYVRVCILCIFYCLALQTVDSAVSSRAVQKSASRIKMAAAHSGTKLQKSIKNYIEIY